MDALTKELGALVAIEVLKLNIRQTIRHLPYTVIHIRDEVLQRALCRELTPVDRLKILSSGRSGLHPKD